MEGTGNNGSGTGEEEAYTDRFEDEENYSGDGNGFYQLVQEM